VVPLSDHPEFFCFLIFHPSPLLRTNLISFPPKPLSIRHFFSAEPSSPCLCLLHLTLFTRALPCWTDSSLPWESFAPPPCPLFCRHGHKSPLFLMTPAFSPFLNVPGRLLCFPQFVYVWCFMACAVRCSESLFICGGWTRFNPGGVGSPSSLPLLSLVSLSSRCCFIWGPAPLPPFRPRARW